jgi:ATP-binding cassette, subfamily B, bacterial
VLGTRALPRPLVALLRHVFGPRALGSAQILDLMVATMLVVAVVDALFTFVGGLLTRTIGQRVIFELRVRIFDHIQRLSISFHKNSRVGDLSARLTSDIQSIQDMVSTGLNSLITNAMTVVGVLAVVALIDVRFALLMLCAAPLVLFVGNSYRRRILQASRRVRTIEGQIGATAQEKIGAIQVVQAFANEDEESRLFAQQTRKSLNAGLAVSWLQSELSPLVDLVGVMSLAAIVWLGARKALARQLTAGDLILFITYLRSVLNPIRNLSKLSSQFSKADASVERIQEVLDIEPDVHDLPGARPAPRLRGAVAFEGVWFGYDDTAPVLRDVNLRVEPGTMVALVGATGSGKSTLLSLISRFHDPQRGQVALDGIDVRRFTLRSLRDQIGLVLQDPVLFSGTIRDNIAYGRPGVSDVEILRAAKMANVHEFVARLPDGYATSIGERGATLSGGQRQRISIARAIVRGAPVLLLDEPTSGLDAESEALVMEALQRLMASSTTFVVAHRLSTVERADLILVLDKGAIREHGTHQQLMRQGGIYAHLHDLQFAHG